MTKLSEDQKNKIRQLLPFNPQLEYDEQCEITIFNQLEKILKNSLIPQNDIKKESRAAIQAQIKILNNIKNDLERIQRGFRQLTPSNRLTLNDGFSFDIFSEIKAAREKQSGDSEIGMEWHHLNMEQIFSSLEYKAKNLVDDMNEKINSSAIFYQNLCDFWEKQRLKHQDITYTATNKFVRLAATLLSKDEGAVAKEISRLNIKNWDDTYIYIKP